MGPEVFLRLLHQSAALDNVRQLLEHPAVPAGESGTIQLVVCGCYL
jgi:hypothetical protein